MAIFSPLRSRRLGNRNLQTVKQFITFLLGDEYFALPIETVIKVVVLGKVYGDNQQTGVSLTVYQGQELLVVDVGHRIFQKQPSILNYQESEQRFLLIIKTSQNELIGLPVDSSPKIRRIAENNVSTLPEGYMTTGNIKCVSSLIIQESDTPPIFLLNPDLLANPQAILPKNWV